VRFLADENIPKALVDALRQAGQDIEWVHADAAGSADEEVAARAIRDHRVIVTFDKDFGELARHAGSAGGYGIILLRVPLSPLSSSCRRLADLIAGRSDWPGKFSVVEPGRIRMRKLPTHGEGES
jgi:predicted nuclease of predicted toxin-antitoxin system